MTFYWELMNGLRKLEARKCLNGLWCNHLQIEDLNRYGKDENLSYVEMYILYSFWKVSLENILFSKSNEPVIALGLWFLENSKKKKKKKWREFIDGSKKNHDQWIPTGNYDSPI